jgi:hypothetical protein
MARARREREATPRRPRSRSGRAIGGLARLAARLPDDIIFTDELERAPVPARREPGESADGAGEAGEGGDSEAATVPLRPRRHRVRAASALGVEVGISTELRALLERCDGERPLRGAIEELARAERTDARELGERLFPDLFELAERGLLRLAP